MSLFQDTYRKGRWRENEKRDRPDPKIRKMGRKTKKGTDPIRKYEKWECWGNFRDRDWKIRDTYRKGRGGGILNHFSCLLSGHRLRHF